MKVEVTITPMYGPADPPPIAITIKDGSKTIIRVEMSPSDFAMALTGRLVFGETTRGALIREAISLKTADGKQGEQT